MKNDGSYDDDDDARSFEEVLSTPSSGSNYDTDKIQKRPER